MSTETNQVADRIAEDLPYSIVEAMGLGYTFRSCTCGQLPCARLQPIRDALNAERERAFDQGYVCAVANIMNLYGEETVAREVLNANRPKDWSIIDPLDMKSLQPIFDHEKAVAAIRGSNH